MPIQRISEGKSSVSGIGRIGALPGDYPIAVAPGGMVRLSRVDFTYSGPAQILVVGWGLKKLGFFGTGFNNGKGLEGGPSMAGYASFTVQESQDRKYSFQVNATMFILMDTPEDIYDAFVWISTQPTPNEAEILRIETDSNIIKVQKLAGGVGDMQAEYQSY